MHDGTSIAMQILAGAHSTRIGHHTNEATLKQEAACAESGSQDIDLTQNCWTSTPIK